MALQVALQVALQSRARTGGRALYFYFGRRVMYAKSVVVFRVKPYTTRLRGPGRGETCPLEITYNRQPSACPPSEKIFDWGSVCVRVLSITL